MKTDNKTPASAPIGTSEAETRAENEKKFIEMIKHLDESNLEKAIDFVRYLQETANTVKPVSDLR